MAETFGNFDFGLDAEQEARAARLHRESVIIDILFQGPVGYRYYDAAMEAEIASKVEKHHHPYESYLDALFLPVEREAKGLGAGMRDTWLASGLTGGNRQFDCDPEHLIRAFAWNTYQFDRFEWLEKALSAEDFRAAKRAGHAAGFLSCQDVNGIERSLAVLDQLHHFGAIVMGLTYNFQNLVGSGCTDRADGGISDFGVTFIKRMNELGIVVDTAHSGKQTTLDCCAISGAPVICSHSSAEAVYRHDRAKSDEEIKALAATGGVIGVVAVPFFLSGDEHVTVDAMLDHIDYIAGLVGVEHLAIGTDWPMQSPKSVLRGLTPFGQELGFRAEHNIDWEVNLIGFDDYLDLPNVTRGLVKRGYSDDAIRGILGENFLRVLEGAQSIRTAEATEVLVAT